MGEWTSDQLGQVSLVSAEDMLMCTYCPICQEALNWRRYVSIEKLYADCCGIIQIAVKIATRSGAYFQVTPYAVDDRNLILWPIKKFVPFARPPKGVA